MIIVNIQLSENDPDQAVQLEASFDPELPSDAFEHKEALGRILLGNSSWVLVVSEVVRYLMLHCFTYNWCIRVLQGRTVVRRLESGSHPPPEARVNKPSRLSRYERTPVI